jgi:HEAT repeat protein
VPLLIDYAHHTDSHLRGLAASTLGQIAASQRGRADVQRAIPVLEKLSRDPDSSVRRAAVEALGKFSSERVISPLKLALRDVDPDVVKSASEAIANFKDYRGNRLKNVKSPKPKSVNRK